VCVVLTSAAFAQFSPRSIGMGSAGIGVADDAIAWAQNPAGLGALDLKCQENKLWAADVIGAYGHMNDNSAWSVSGSGWQPAMGMGVGAGYLNVQDSSTAIGAGFGMALKQMPLSLGASVKSVNPDGPGDTNTLIDVGAMYKFPQPLNAPIRVGLVARDITDQVKTSFDVGIAWPATPKCLVAVDVVDLADDLGFGARFNAGVEYKFGQMNEWTARIGEFDNGDSNKLTLGAGYALANNWRLDAAWADGEGSSTWSVGAGVGF